MLWSVTRLKELDKITLRWCAVKLWSVTRLKELGRITLQEERNEAVERKAAEGA